MDPYDVRSDPDRHHPQRLEPRRSLDTTRSCITCRETPLLCDGEKPRCLMCCLRGSQCLYEDARPAYDDLDGRSAARQRGNTARAEAHIGLRLQPQLGFHPLSKSSDPFAPRHPSLRHKVLPACFDNRYNVAVCLTVAQLSHELLGCDPELSRIKSQSHTPMDEIVIREFKRLAAEGCHADVADALDNCMNSIHRPSRLHTSLFHTLRKICTEYSYLPNSLFLPPQTITGISNDARATGGYADVYIARQYGNLTGDYLVCVKAVRISDRDKSGARMKIICKEALLWSHLSHPNITPFYGMVTQFNGRSIMGMVCKWMPNGHIVEFIERFRNVRRPPLLLDAAYGLQYLHSEVDIVHGDIKGTNILVDELGHACLADFGLSTVLYGTDTLNTATRVSSFRSTVRWMAPELHDPEIFGLEDATPTRESDIYSFSMTMWEVFTGQVPYPEARLDGPIIRKIVDGQRPSLPPPEVAGPLGLSPAVWDMMQACWWHDPPGRPPIAHVVKTLSRVE